MTLKAKDLSLKTKVKARDLSLKTKAKDIINEAKGIAIKIHK